MAAFEKIMPQIYQLTSFFKSGNLNFESSHKNQRISTNLPNNISLVLFQLGSTIGPVQYNKPFNLCMHAHVQWNQRDQGIGERKKKNVIWNVFWNADVMLPYSSYVVTSFKIWYNSTSGTFVMKGASFCREKDFAQRSLFAGIQELQGQARGAIIC